MRSVLRWGVLGAQGEHRRAARHHTAQASSAQIQPQTGCSCGCHLWLQQWLLVKVAQGGSLCGVFPGLRRKPTLSHLVVQGRAPLNNAWLCRMAHTCRTGGCLPWLTWQSLRPSWQRW